MAKAKTLKQLISETYESEELQKAISEDVAKIGTESRIISGELVLPTEEQAQKWHDRITGKDKLTPEQQQSQARMVALEQLVKELADLQVRQNPERASVVKQRMADMGFPIKEGK